VELYLHSDNTPSWRGASKKHGDTFTFTFKGETTAQKLITMYSYVRYHSVAGLLNDAVSTAEVVWRRIR
jgi:hypothetical protein